MVVPVKMVLTIQSIMTVGLIWKIVNTLMRNEPTEIFSGTVIVESQLPITVMQMPNRIFLLKKLSRCITLPNMAISFSFRMREI